MNYILKNDYIQVFKDLNLEENAIIYLKYKDIKDSVLLGEERSIIEALKEVIGSDYSIVTNFKFRQSFDLAFFDGDLLSCKEIKSKLINTANLYKNICGDNLVEALKLEDYEISPNYIYPYIAIGKIKAAIKNNQALNYPEGSDSPLGLLYNLKAYCILINTDYSETSIFRLSEFFSKKKAHILNQSKDNSFRLVNFLDYETNPKDYDEIGKLLEKENLVKIFNIKDHVIKVFKIEDAINLGQKYLISKY